MALHARRARLAKGRLRPWITLLVLDGRRIHRRPEHQGQARFPTSTSPTSTVFPRADELWAWAHVHVNRSLAANDAEFVSQDMAAVLPKLHAVLAGEPRPRLLASRVSAEARGEHGLSRVPDPDVRGRPPRRSRPRARRCGGDDVGVGSWRRGPKARAFPYYHRWYFRTGTHGDFETLVRLLVPKPVDPRVGFREMDVQVPGSKVRGVDKPELDGILKLGGALQPPATVPPEPPDSYETWDDPFPRPLQEDLARLINLPDDYQRDRRSRSDHHAAALRHVACADEARADEARRLADPAARQLGPPAEPRSAVPRRCRVRHARHPGSAGKVHGRGVGADRQGARGADAASGSASSACRSAHLVRPPPRARRRRQPAARRCC